MVEVNQREVIDDLNKFLSHCEEITDRVCAALSWDKQKLSSETGELVSCQLDPGHRVPREKLASHIEKCRLRQQGLSQDEIDELVPSSMFYYEKATNVYSTVIDKEKLNHILRQQNAGIFTEKEVPPCGRLASVELSPAERLAIHQSVISSAVQAGKPVTEITDDFLLTDFTKKNKKEQDQPKTREETLAVQRDLKRRRQTYRAKNVHITRKSYTEVIREVIESQTEMLSAAAQDEESKDGESARLKSDTRRSRSPKKRSKSQDQDSKSQSRRRSRSRSQSCKRSTSPRNQDSRSARKSKHHKRSRSRSSSRKKKSRDSPSENDSEDSRGHSRSRKHKHKSKHKKHKSNR